MESNLRQEFFGRLNDFFLSDRLAQESMSDARQRALILVCVVAISAVSGLGLTITLGTLYRSSGELLYLLATSIAALTLIGYLGTLWFFRKRQALLPAAHLYALTTTFSTVAPCAITGGMSESPYFTLVLVVPIFLFLIAGRQSGTYWSLVTVVCVAVFLLLELSGVTFPQVIPDTWLGTFRFVTWLTTLVLLVLGLLTYETNFESLTGRLAHERSHFAHEALHDPLTGLANRKLFFTRAREAVDYAQSRQHKAAIIFIDLDQFKPINDSHGHDIGDEVLKVVAGRLQANVRSIDTVARIGGDEFAVVLHGIEHAEVADFMADKLYSALQDPLRVSDRSLVATGSIGVAVAPDQGLDVDQLLRMADEAMYRAKDARENAG